MKKSYLLFIPAAIALTGCSKFGKLTADDVTVTPTPLEYVAGNVPATISINVPEKFMPKKGTVTCTPVLRWEGGQATGQSASFQGESVEGNNTVVPYKTSSNQTMRTNFPFQMEMAKSDLYMTFEAKKGNKTVEIPEVKIGYGVQCTAALISKAAQTSGHSIAQDKFQRVIANKQEAAIKFLINQANLRGGELNSQNIKDFIAKLKELKADTKNYALNNIEVSAYASPDGKYDFNEKLAEKRGDNSEGYVNSQLKKEKMDAKVDMKYTAEDWEGFQELVKQSNIQDKDVILRVLSMYQDPEQREQEIKNIATVYKELADAILPELRRSRLTINYDVIGRSDAEILEQFKSDASKLSVEELLYAGNKLVNTNSEKEAIYKKAIELYPNDYRAYNNLGVVNILNGDNATAEANLRKAISKNSANPEASINLGNIAIQKGDFNSVETLVAKGTTAPNANEALGNLYVAQGKYDQAAAKFAGSANNSAALAQIMAKNYADANKTLDAIKTPDALTYYLKAVAAARQDKSSDILSNLKQAVQKDASYKKMAQNDVEFAKYASIVNGL